MRFTVDDSLLEKARHILWPRRNLYWIVGGACSGKSTICRVLADRYGFPIYDMDSYIYDRYQPRYTAERHPANTAWFSAENGLAWLLAMSWEEFDAFNRAANAEYLDLLADDLADSPPDGPLLVDGGISNPAVLTGAAPPDQVVCLAIPEAMGTRIWEEAADRRFMKEMVEQLPAGPAAWKKFLHFDTMISRTSIAESRAGGFWVCFRDEDTPVEALVTEIAAHFGLDGR